MDKLINLFKSCRSTSIFGNKNNVYFKLPCLGTTLDLLYRVKFNKKLEEETKVFDRFIYPNSICFDIGTAYGRLTYLISKIAKRGKVYSFEPGNYSFKVLSYLKKLSGLKNVVPENLALYDKKTTVTLLIPEDKNRKKLISHLSHISDNDNEPRKKLSKEK